MNITEIKKQIEEKHADIYLPDKETWEELFYVQVCNNNTYNEDEWDSRECIRELYVCKEENGTFYPKIYWVRLRLEHFKQALSSFKNEDKTNIRFIFEWGDGDGCESIPLQIECVTGTFIYFTPLENGEV